MKDIDFDELDRAVSSVLGQKAPSAEDKKDVETDKAPSETDVQPAEELTTAADDNIVPDADTPAAPPEAEKPEKPVSTPLAIKRRGKFMDVMHPSADMQPGANVPGPKSHRSAPVVAPLLREEAESSEVPTAEPIAALDEGGALIGAEPASAESDFAIISDDESSITLETAETTTVVDESADSSSHETDETETISATATDDTTESESDDLVADADTTDESQTAPAGEEKPTPFLSDTQVEKRPLGAFGENEGAPSQADNTVDDIAPSADADLQPAATPAALPRELQPDVVNVESVHEAEAEQAAAASADTATGSITPFAAKVPVAPEANDGRVEGHPLFDTSTYHEPIAAVHSRGMPGWAKWAIGLLVCLSIGAGVGYFLFTAGL